MEFLYTFLTFIIVLVLGYLFGSIPCGILIGKLHGIDIREYGSHNSGGTNVGRTLGKKAGIMTIILDIFKCYLPLLIVLLIVTLTPIDNFLLKFNQFNEFLIALCALAVLLGHSFPIFAQFKGGKAVSCIGGYILFVSPIIFVITLICFLIYFSISHKISVCSIASAPTITILFCIPMILDFTILNNPKSFNGGVYFGPVCMLHLTYITLISIILGATFVVIRHKANIQRLKNHTEPITHFENNVTK